MNLKRIKGFFRKGCPKASAVFFIIALTAFILQIIFKLSPEFSDFFNRYISSLIRGAMALVSSIFPFSLAETLIVSIPLWVTAVLVIGIRVTAKGRVEGTRFVFGLASVLALLYGLFVFTSTAGYRGTSLASKLGLSDEPVSANDLAMAADYMVDKMEEVLDEIEYIYGGSSVMPYSLSEMSNRLIDAYDKGADKYPFISCFWSKVKPIALSEPMSYTHITGIYTYYTGEANININFPDYSLPFTAAHELAHQRGILPEDEANFVAFLICCESDDPYIRYSGYLNMLEYLNNALFSADYHLYAEVYSRLDIQVKYEMQAYSEFFKKYSDNKAADISSVLNDTYLKMQGENEGEKSYGMVVDLAVAYVKSVTAE